MRLSARKPAIAVAATLAAAAFVLALPGRSSAPAQPDCHPTRANGSAPPGEAGGDHHGNGKLWTSLNRTGIYTVAEESSPVYLASDRSIAVDGVLLPNGSLGIKARGGAGKGCGDA